MLLGTARQASNRVARRRQSVLQDTTLRDFSGGWDVIDNQLNMTPKYQPVLDNVRLFEDGTLGVRYGTTYFSGGWQLAEVNPDVAIDRAQNSGTTIGNATANADAAFNDITDDLATCCRGVNILNIGKDWGAPAGGHQAVYGVRITPPAGFNNLVEHSSPVRINLRLQSSEDNVTWNDVVVHLDVSSEVPGLPAVFDMVYNFAPGVDEHSVPESGSSLPNISEVRYTRLQIECIDTLGDPNIVIGEIEFWSADDPRYEVGWIVHMTYFQDRIIVFTSSGKIYSVQGNGNATVIWSEAIAGALPGAPTGWNTNIDFVSTTTFGGDLIACNGIDKPLIINLNGVGGGANSVEYLTDPVSGNNLYVPIARYVLGINDFVVMAGTATQPSTVYISDYRSAGVWTDDDGNNNGDGQNVSVNIDLSKTVPANDNTIRGLGRFRTNLIVGMDDVSVIGVLGNRIDTSVPPDNVIDTHEPDFSDVLWGHGTIAHHSMVNLGDDLLMCDNVGVPSVRRGIYTATAEPQRASELIDPEIQKTLEHLKISTTTKHVFAVHNAREKQYMLFVPNHDTDVSIVNFLSDPFSVAEIGTGRLYVDLQDTIQKFRVGDQILLSGTEGFNNFTAAQLYGPHIITAVPSFLGRPNVVEINIDGVESNGDPDQQVGGGAVVSLYSYFTETIGYIYSRLNETKIKAWARFRNWKWMCGTSSVLNRVFLSNGADIFTYGDRGTPAAQDYLGTPSPRPIEFAWETPWADFDKRMVTKESRYISIDTVGYASFDVSMFVDQNYYGTDNQLDPLLKMSMTGGDIGGYGAGAQPFGGGRSTSTERLYAWPAKFKIAKLRFSGEVTEPLQFVSTSIAYQRGSIRR